MNEPATHRKAALITGANKAISRAIAEQLAALGMTVLIGAGRLDALANNAGITGSGQVSPEDARDQIPSSVDLDMVRTVFETNVFGVIAVTNALLPLLRKAPAPRIVNVSSAAGSLTIAADPGYVDTDINDHSGYLAPAQGAAVAVRLATLADDGPTAGFFNADGPLPW
ncbi:SDR family NAD(P)-dependent oxidoreductase [Streptomyces sp. Ag109_G2-15]|uniref:SDR family NAD(P)-dependent oxidoreductase n=1 Tax=Streptomyces sp. Ag109_G2-15 TaxID=1938850 RepID=UPI000BD566BB|nr:SDR family NAD(P)-dependent oxidoreductase [Streptomyces sp. Ag109_G2-15]SOD80966.1 short chain dehydrogenase [Streptomyces sp. Ag109_G2-15]